MKKVQLALGLSFLAVLAFGTRADEDKNVHRPFPSPRKSGQGRVAFTSDNVQLMSWLTLSDLSGGATSGNDCWGYTSPSGREYAIIGTSDGTAFVEITDPGDAQLIAFRTGPNSLWRDIKTYGDNAYAVSEGGSGIQIFDMSAIDSGTVTLVNTITAGGCTTASHNVVIDTTSGYLYRCGGSGSPCPGSLPQGLVIYNLGANPDNPPFVALWSTRYVHDCQVVVSTRPGALNGAQLAFCPADDGSGGGTANLQILNVTNKAAITTVATGSYSSNSFSHQLWLTPDQRYVYLNDELDEETFGFNTRTRVFDVSNPATPVFLGFFSSGVTAIDHNLYVRSDNKIFEANYRSGLRVFDNSVSPTTPSVYGYFDTYEQDDLPDFNGMWSNYPYFPSGTVIGSDIEKGLFVFRIGAAKLNFAFPGGNPEFVAPTGQTIQFEVNENMVGDLQSGTVFLRASTGGPFSFTSATSLGGNLYQATLPAAACGTKIQYFVSAQSTDGATWSDPQGNGNQVYQAIAAYGQTIALNENFETASGWLVDQASDLTGFTTATTGNWVRVNPIGTAAQPEDDHSVPGTICYVTGQGTVGGGLGDQDIDNGATSLRSPVLNASGLSDPYLSYWRWYSNNQNGVVDDVMTVDISNNGGTSWVNVETLGPAGGDSVGGWILHSLRIADFVTPTSNMRVRFRASDLGSGSIVEAAVDDIQIIDYDCTPPTVTVDSISQSSGSFDGGNIVTILGSGFGPGTSVSFGNNVANAVNVISSSVLNVRVPSARGGTTGGLRRADTVVDVTVSNPGSATLPHAYTYTIPQK